MADRLRSDELARLRGEIAAVRAECAALRRQVARRRRSRHRRFIPAAALALLLALVPLGLLAANPFTDLDPGSVHNADIDALYTAGITTGCVPNARYCPADFVTREQMASFLARTAGLGSNPPVARALTAETATNAAHAATADNASALGGLPASGFVRASAALVHTATVANSTANFTIIDHPLTNAEPARYLLATQELRLPSPIYNPHPIGVYYSSAFARWTIINEDGAGIPAGATFIVLVIEP
jgi:hypothetical protein